jgi:hypothetical protein
MDPSDRCVKGLTEDFESEKMRLNGLGLKVNATVHGWLHVRSLYFYDPRGNLLGFVCGDAIVKKE